MVITKKKIIIIGTKAATVVKPAYKPSNKKLLSRGGKLADKF
jgi:hypothetical protein